MPRTVLPEGERITSLHALADRLSTNRYSFSPTNPASIDDRHRLVRLRLPKGNLPFVNETVALVVDGTCMYRFGPAQDPRGVWFGSHLFVFYSRVADASRLISSRPSEIRMALRNLSAPEEEVLLRQPSSASPFRKFFNWEKNWTPFLHQGTLYLSYRLEPHVGPPSRSNLSWASGPPSAHWALCSAVLRCNWGSGSCDVAHHTNSTAAWAHHRTSLRMGARGSSPAVLLRGFSTFLGIAHFRTQSGVYEHCFYEFGATPPFVMLRSSGRFVFNASSRIQFVAGMYKLRDSLVVSYGVGDVAAMETRIPISAALSLLRRSNVRTRTFAL